MNKKRPRPIEAVLADLKKQHPGIKEKPDHPHSDGDPKCLICHGFGWSFSEIHQVWHICTCVKEAGKKRIIQSQEIDCEAVYGLTSDEMKLTWNAVAPNISDGIKAVNAVKPFYERGYGFIYLWGSWGQGKTLVGKILIATAIRDHKIATFGNMLSILDNIRMAFDQKEFMTTALLRKMEHWISRDVLFIDELDKCNETNWARERIFQLLDQRYVGAVREQSLTVVASNESADQLDGYIRSRLHDRRIGKIVELRGGDGREAVPDGWIF